MLPNSVSHSMKLPIILPLLFASLLGIMSTLEAKCVYPTGEDIGLLYEANTTGQTKTHHFDQVGSTILRTDDTGKVIATAEYSAYGLIALQTGDLATPFLYNGQAGVQTDPNGLLNMRARYYSPYLMRFLNADPSGFSGGSNWFAYADGNPISMSDPFGLCAESGGGLWQGIKNSAVNFIGSTLEGWENQDRKIAAGAAKYNDWYNQQTPFVQNAELSKFVGIPPAYITNFSDHKGEVLVMGTLALLSDGLIRGGPLAEAETTVYRGVHAGHPDMEAALQGRANPIGGHSNPFDHSDGNNFSNFSSWTTDRATAEGFSNLHGLGGVILEQSVPSSSLIRSQTPMGEFESEYLRTGLTQGATVHH